MKNIERVKEGFDLLAIARSYMQSDADVDRLLSAQYDVLRWILCEEEDDKFESLLELIRVWMRANNAHITRVMPSGRVESGADYRAAKKGRKKQ